MFTHISGVRVHHCMGIDIDTCVHECVALIIMHYGHAADACARKHANMTSAHSVHSIGGRVRVVLTVYVASRWGVFVA